MSNNNNTNQSIQEETLNLFEAEIQKEIKDAKVTGIPHSKNESYTVKRVYLDQIRVLDVNSIIYLEEEDDLQLEELKASILSLGLLHAPLVKVSRDTFTLIAGHRRFKALKALVEEGYTQFKSIDVVIRSFDSEVDELEARLDSNVITRNESEYSKMMLVSAYQKAFQKRLELNQISGTKVEKTYIANKMHMSERQVVKYLYIRKRLDNVKIKELTDHKISLNQIYDLMKENGDVFDNDSDAKPIALKNKKEKPLPKLTKDEQRKLVSLKINIDKLREQNERLIEDLNSKKQITKRLKKLKISLTTAFFSINEILNESEQFKSIV